MSAYDPNPKPETVAAASREAEAGGVLTIDLAAIAANWKQLTGMVAPAECAAVIKADGYGCGLARVAERLVKAGCRTFFVADLGEGRRLRAVAPEGVIYVLNGVLTGTAPAIAKAHLRPVINSPAELAEWDAFVAANNWRGGAALHVDTGINRLGMSVADATVTAAQRGEHGISLLMSHLACADRPDHPLNQKQERLFHDLRNQFPGTPASLAASYGIFAGRELHCDLVRPGACLLGVNPTPGRANPMRPVIELKGRIVQVRTLQAGDGVGYGATFTAGRASRIAVVAVGYADGYLRAAGASKGKPPAEVIVAGKHCPLAGRVSMDLLAVDVTEVPEHHVRRGDLVTLIGGDIDIDQLGAWSGTIGYEVLTSLGHRYHRVYKE